MKNQIFSIYMYMYFSHFTFASKQLLAIQMLTHIWNANQETVIIFNHSDIGRNIQRIICGIVNEARNYEEAPYERMHVRFKSI